MSVRAFMSYSHEDKHLAGDVKKAMSDYGIEVFMAHEDIKLSSAWVAIIQAELRRCDLFLLLLTNNFPHSKWTDQEAGIALALDKLIVPLSVHILPYGFIGAIQAVTLNPERPRVACRHVASAFIEHRPGEQSRFLDGFIPKFVDSDSYDEAGRNASVLVECDRYSAEQVQNVLRGIVENRQIHESGSARDHLNEFLKRYAKVDPKLARKAKRAMGQ